MKRTIATLGVVGLGLMGATVAANAAPPGKISICHATGSASNPYLFETISLNALSAHVGDTGDIVPANSGDDMPDGQNLTPENIALLANGCVVAGPVVPVDPGPVDPGPVDPGPVDPGPVDPGPVEPPAVVPPAVVPVDSVVPPAVVPPAAAPPAAAPPAVAPPAAAPLAATVAPVSAAPQGAAATGVPAASNVGYNVQTAVGSSGPGVPAWLAALTVLFSAVGAWVLVKGSLRSRGANG
ncbi:hypothetical protein [Arthrobacter sp. 24S4-2]|uniref:hypothetical protein n=1 Tax=Arthrobacter sp. 24S4-2 TaxID=2575374 RepID=UPI001586675B|nr:hypothetical protein [Arthrobacter sp. 24S4-2]